MIRLEVGDGCLELLDGGLEAGDSLALGGDLVLEPCLRGRGLRQTGSQGLKLGVVRGLRHGVEIGEECGGRCQGGLEGGQRVWRRVWRHEAEYGGVSGERCKARD